MEVVYVTYNSPAVFRLKDIEAINPHYAETANVTRQVEASTGEPV